MLACSIRMPVSGFFFSFLHNLIEEIYTQLENLKKLNSNLLSGLKSLEKLWLNDNCISELDADVFNNLENLKIIYLYNNKLKKSQMSQKFFNTSTDQVKIYFD